jgi:hypothetical protein
MFSMRPGRDILLQPRPWIVLSYSDFGTPLEVTPRTYNQAGLVCIGLAVPPCLDFWGWLEVHWLLPEVKDTLWIRSLQQDSSCSGCFSAAS